MKPAEGDDEQQAAELQEKPKVKEEKVFDRSVRVPPKTRLKNIRRFILENLGVQDICTARIYSCTRPAKVEDEKKEDSEEENKEAKKADDALDADV